METTLALPTADGPCSVQLFFDSEQDEPRPAVLLFFDAGGQREAMSVIARRIASRGSLVAVPDLYHRLPPLFELLPPGAPHELMAILGDAAVKNQWMAEYLPSAMSYANLEVTVGALLDHLAGMKEVRREVGTTGYCMGGNISLRVATIFGARIAATASFHGGGLVSPAPDSPHRRLDRVKSRVYIAGASDDDSFTDGDKGELIRALDAAKVGHTVETYPAKHGFAVTDAPVYDRHACERHHAAMDALFASTLR